MERWEEAAKAGDIDKLYALLQEDGKLLQGFDEEAFIDTPLHVAASHGCTHFALEILRLKPWFGKKLNPDGFSPLHLALRNGHKKTVERLVKHEPQLIRVQGREGITPLHYVVESGDFHLLAEFLMACPASLEDLTIRGETAVHVAVRNGRVAAFKVLLGWLQRTENLEVLNWKDEDGDTAMHVAARADQLEILKLLIGKVININKKNSKGLTALDIATEQKNERIRKALKRGGAAKGSSVATYETWAEFLTSKPKKIQESIVGFDVYLEKGLSGDMRNALLVVAVLIATATYQALLQPPGGLSQGGDNLPFSIEGSYSNGSANATISKSYRYSLSEEDPGKAIMEEEYFYVFIVLNSIAFAASLGMIFALLPREGYNTLLYISLWFMFVNYMCSGLVISPETASDITLYSLQGAFGLYLLIIAARLPNKLRNFPWVLRMWSKAYHHREMARSVFLLKYSQEGDN